MKFKDSETYKQIMSAFAGECQAYLAYTFYANQAEKEGLAPLANLLREIAENEKEHAEVFFKKLNNGSSELPSAKEGLKRAFKGETFECEFKYKNAAKIAQSEGFFDIALIFDKIKNIEDSHARKFRLILDELNMDKLYTSDSENCMWVCSKCGNIEYGKTPPDKCPVCEHENTYYVKK